MSGTKRGFTLIEMLVVIGIIAVLSGALMMGFGRITKSAQRAKATELVSQAAQALVILHHTDGTWPSAVINFGGGDGDGTADKGMVKDVAEVLAQYNLLSVACKDRAKKDYTPIGVSRCGVVDPWAEAVLKRDKNADAGSQVPSGGTVRDHIIYFAVDEDGDGITTASVGREQVNVRAEAIAWCAGADGKIAEYKERGRSDDIYSWDKAKEKR